jgi:hypothetical protein
MKFWLKTPWLTVCSCLLLFGFRSIAVARPDFCLAGTYTDNVSAQQALCHDSSCNPIPCSQFDSGDILTTFIIQALGEHTMDSNSNSCGSFTVVSNDLPLGSSVPSAFTGIGVNTLTDYNPSTGVGDLTSTEYSAGSCNGASFNSSGSTNLGTSTVHFIGSENGQRIDSLLTGVDQKSNVGSYVQSDMALKR